MSLPNDGPVAPHLDIPLLSTVIDEADIPDGLRAALDARAWEKSALTALASELVLSLQAQLARESAQWVQASVQKVWAQRHGHDLDRS